MKYFRAYGLGFSIGFPPLDVRQMMLQASGASSIDHVITILTSAGMVKVLIRGFHVIFEKTVFACAGVSFFQGTKDILDSEFLPVSSCRTQQLLGKQPST